MHARLKPVAVLAGMLVAFLLESFPLDAQNAGRSGDSWYLLVRRADRPEKNYYKLSKSARFFEPQGLSDELFRHLQSSPQFEILNANAFSEIWQASKQSTEPAR